MLFGARKELAGCFSGKALLGPRSGCVLVADGCDNANFPHAPKHMGSNIGTAGLVTEIFGKQFFTAVRSREARLDRYLRNWRIP